MIYDPIIADHPEVKSCILRATAERQRRQLAFEDMDQPFEVSARELKLLRAAYLSKREGPETIFGMPIAGSSSPPWRAFMQDPIYRRATEIANQVCGGPPTRCFGWKAKIWDADWDGACTALGGDPADYVAPPPA